MDLPAAVRSYSRATDPQASYRDWRAEAAECRLPQSAPRRDDDVNIGDIAGVKNQTAVNVPADRDASVRRENLRLKLGRVRDRNVSHCSCGG